MRVKVSWLETTLDWTLYIGDLWKVLKPSNSQGVFLSLRVRRVICTIVDFEWAFSRKASFFHHFCAKSPPSKGPKMQVLLRLQLHMHL